MLVTNGIAIMLITVPRPNGLGIQQTKTISITLLRGFIIASTSARGVAELTNVISPVQILESVSLLLLVDIWVEHWVLGECYKSTRFLLKDVI